MYTLINFITSLVAYNKLNQAVTVFACSDHRGREGERAYENQPLRFPRKKS